MRSVETENEVEERKQHEACALFSEIHPGVRRCGRSCFTFYRFRAPRHGIGFLSSLLRCEVSKTANTQIGRLTTDPTAVDAFLEFFDAREYCVENRRVLIDRFRPSKICNKSSECIRTFSSAVCQATGTNSLDLGPLFCDGLHMISQHLILIFSCSNWHSRAGEGIHVSHRKPFILLRRLRNHCRFVFDAARRSPSTENKVWMRDTEHREASSDWQWVYAVRAKHYMPLHLFFEHLCPSKWVLTVTLIHIIGLVSLIFSTRFLCGSSFSHCHRITQNRTNSIALRSRTRARELLMVLLQRNWMHNL